MIPEIGHFTLILSFLVALSLGVFSLVGAHRGNVAWMQQAHPAAILQFLLVAMSFAALMHAFVTSDFSVAYVAQNSNTSLPTIYKVAGVWGGHEGSLLLWVLMLSGWTLAVSLRARSLPLVMQVRVLGVLGLVSAGFQAFVLATSNPFLRVLPAPENGNDLNPMLQDPGLVIHPPMLYMGYVGFSVAFAFAIAALLSGRLDAVWARWSRPWTIAAWVFLTFGIVLGSGWAYYTLGWGGWWFWDPVENASFMPWLVGTGLIHALAVTDKRGAFKNWTVLLAICAFSLSLLGTFLVRSGVLTSVHAFATDPRRGIFILMLLVTVIGSSLLLYAWRAPQIGLGDRFEVASRETLLLVNSLVLVVASATVLLGTLYPLIVDALGLGKLSVGPPYFEAVFLPLMIPVMVMVVFGPLAQWKKTNVPALLKQVSPVLVLSLLVGAVTPWLLGHWKPLAAVGLALATWVGTGTLYALWRRARQGSPGLAYWGMCAAHFGLAVFIAGVTIVKGYEIERDVRMEAGDTVTIGRYQVVFTGIHASQGPNYHAMVGNFDLRIDGQLDHVLHPEKRTFQSSGMPMTDAAIDTGPFRDIYVSLGDPLDEGKPEGAWSVRVHYKPLVAWIWAGGLMMMLGGILAMLDRRYAGVKRIAAVPAAPALMKEGA